MPNIITDTSNNPISTVRESAYRNSFGGQFTVRIYCKAGYKIKSHHDPDVQILVRKSGTTDAFQDVAISPVDLTPFVNTYQDFDVKPHIDLEAVRYSSHNLSFLVTPN